MPENDGNYQPKGYCPKCGYAIDPGRCTECGTQVSPKQLAKSPNARRNKLYKEIFAGLLVSLVFGFVLHSLRDGLPALYPTPLLLSWYGDGSDSVACELWHRYENGRLSESQERRALNLAFHTEGLYVDCPYPTGAVLDANTYYSFDINLGRIYPVARVDYGSWEIRVDGEIIRSSPRDYSDEFVRVLGSDSSSGHGWKIPPLPAGNHKIDIRREFYLVSMKEKNEQRVHTWTFSEQAFIVIEDPPIEGLYAPALDDDIARQVEASFQMPAVDSKPNLPDHMLQIAFDKPPVFVSMSCWARVCGTEEYHPIATVYVPPGETRLTDLDWRKLPGYEKATHADIRLIPYPWGAAQFEQQRSYYGRTIERLNVPIKDATPTNESGP